jgi:hypothetical protein
MSRGSMAALLRRLFSFGRQSAADVPDVKCHPHQPAPHRVSPRSREYPALGQRTGHIDKEVQVPDMQVRKPGKYVRQEVACNTDASSR